MKKIYFLMLAACSACTASAQTTNCNKSYTDDKDLGRWTADLNLLGGGLKQNLTIANPMPNYLNGVNMNIGNTSFSKGGALGADAQLGFFIGRQRNWGIGTGLMYVRQWGRLTQDNYHVEYQSTDPRGETFRQVISAGSITETIKTDVFNIPLVLKYKNRFSKHWGFTADAGALINIGMRNGYKTNASFDYEAIYKYNTNPDGSRIAVYDAAPTPSDRDFLITQSHVTRNNPEQNIQDYFTTQRELGYNVGLGVRPTRNTGKVSYATGAIGFLFQPSVNYFFSDDVALNIGGYYSYLPATNANNSYKLTDKVGEYNSLLNNVSRNEAHSFGGNAGVRFFFGKAKDRDHDGVPDKKDLCPDVYGLAIFQGCPDTDGDGIPDREDSCVDVKGLLIFHGCPDTDGDGIPDPKDACPLQAGPRELNGCPDTDGDGIADKDDLCPTIPGLAKYHGCPDTDGDGVPDNLDKCPTEPGLASNQGCPLDTVKMTTLHGNIMGLPNISTPILFELNKAVIHKSSYPLLQTAAEQIKSNPEMRIVIDGHADITGPVAFNNALSQKRANAVRNYLVKLGADPKRLKAVGHGSRAPMASNKTSEGRKKNRRAVMTAKEN